MQMKNEKKMTAARAAITIMMVPLKSEVAATGTKTEITL
jgi:hypothetical protein